MSFIVCEVLSLEDALARVERAENDVVRLTQERDEARAAYEKERQHTYEYECLFARADTERDEARAECAKLRAVIARLRYAVEYVAHHLEHGGLYGPAVWCNEARARCRAALAFDAAKKEKA